MRITQVRALIVVGFLTVVAIATSLFAIASDSQTASGSQNCDPGDVPVDISLPEEHDINVRITNATDGAGLAEAAKEALDEYGFNVEDISTDKQKTEAPAELYYGPNMVAGGHLLRAYFASSEHHFSLDNDTDYVEVVLGEGFQQVNTKSDARNALGIIGHPQAPDGTCPTG
ncbi:MAG TPA: LytR C-terminal domain-containing protein [Candidatus Stackebrandtia faecavium]|nr:LytR C-terminal domain-containing protein [Candidatus Stackebrandtia faecavium]